MTHVTDVYLLILVALGHWLNVKMQTGTRSRFTHY